MPKRPSKPQLPLYKRLWLQSQTKLLAYVQAASAATLAGLDYLNNVVHDQHFNSVLSTMTVDRQVYTIIAVIALLTWLAHGRAQD